MRPHHIGPDFILHCSFPARAPDFEVILGETHIGSDNFDISCITHKANEALSCAEQLKALAEVFPTVRGAT